MDSKNKSKNLPVMLPAVPNELVGTHDDDMFGELVIPMDDLLGQKKEKGTTGVTIAFAIEDEAEDQEIEEDQNQEIYKGEAVDEDPALLVDDDTLKEDFFEVEKHEEEPTYGEIEGISEITEDDKKRLSARKSRADDDEISVDENGKPRQSESSRASVKVSIKLSADMTKQAQDVAEGVKSQEEDVEQTKTINLQTLTISQPRLSEISRVSRYSTGVEIYYEPNKRVADSAVDLMEFFNLDKHDKLILLDEFDNEVEEEEVVSVIEEEPHVLERTPYYEKYEILLDQINENRIKNNILQKKVIMYLKRRKVDNFLKDGEPPLNQVIKYNQKLDAYKEISELCAVQRKSMTEDLESLKMKRTQYCAKLEKLFKLMQTREANVGYGLIFTKTANVIPDKVIERLIKRQKTQMEQVAVMRLKYIKLKGMVQEKLGSIERNDIIENNLHLADYEQLKVDNRNYADKIEERDEELTRLRAKCQNTIQVLAHMREKSSALEQDLNDLKEELEYVFGSASIHRASLVAVKRERDRIRHATVKMKAESGLLTEPDLLRDMDASKYEILKAEEELQSCQNEVNCKTTQIRNLRKNIEWLSEAFNKKKGARLKGANLGSITISASTKSSRTNKSVGRPSAELYPRRPTLPKPIIKPDAFFDLVTIKPNPKMLTRKRR